MERTDFFCRKRKQRTTDLKSLNRVELEQFFKELGEPKFRAKQVFQWLWRGVESFDEMTNLSKALREKLRQSCILTVPKVERKRCPSMHGTIQVSVAAGRRQLRGIGGHALQAWQHHLRLLRGGRRMGLRLLRVHVGRPGAWRLEPSEILDQVMFAQKDSGLTISNIVLMGIGEPLDNYDNVMRFLELVNDPDGAEHRYAPHLIVHLWSGGWD